MYCNVRYYLKHRCISIRLKAIQTQNHSCVLFKCTSLHTEVLVSVESEVDILNSDRAAVPQGTTAKAILVHFKSYPFDCTHMIMHGHLFHLDSHERGDLTVFILLCSFWAGAACKVTWFPQSNKDKNTT